MVTIHIDGKPLHSSAHEDEAHIALDVKPTLDIEGSGSLSFVIPPGNAQYDSIKKMKSIVTYHQDDVLLFRGRVMDVERDFFNQKSVYCEGDRSFLLDSLWEEQTVTGNVQDLFRAMIANHNKQVDEDKRFTVGIVTAVDDEEPEEGKLRVETRKFWDTASMIDSRLISVYGGYLRTRTEGDVHYIDWLKDFDEECKQPIRFSVNLIDLKEKLDAKDVFTVLIPLGYSEIGDDGTYSDPVNITSVNDGVEYIEDEEAVKLYGRIWRTKTWAQTKSPSSLMKKAKKHLKTGTELRTLTIKAVDMHFTDGNVDMIRIGTKVQIESDPHGISLNMVCAKMDIDPDNPENTTYTFGVKPQTLTEGIARADKEVSELSGSGRGGGGGRKSVQEEASDILRWATIFKDEAESLIKLNAGMNDKQNEYLAVAGIDINGKIGEVKLMATKEETNALTGRVEKAEASIIVNAEGISSKVSKNGVISAINQTAETIKIQASKINLEGYVTTEMLKSDAITLRTLNVTAATSTDSLNVSKLATVGSLRVDNHNISLESVDVLTNSTSISVNTSGGAVTGVTLNRRTATLYYMAWN